jgi:hypothetical protein
MRLHRLRNSVSFLRVLTLVLVGFPQFSTVSFPDPPSDGPDPALDAAAAGVAVAGRIPSIVEQWASFVSGSGLALLLPAIVFALPRRHVGNRGLWAAGALGVVGMSFGYAATSLAETAGEAALPMFLSICYVLAAGTFFQGERLALSPEGSQAASGAAADPPG